MFFVVFILAGVSGPGTSTVHLSRPSLAASSASAGEASVAAAALSAVAVVWLKCMAIGRVHRDSSGGSNESPFNDK